MSLLPLNIDNDNYKYTYKKNDIKKNKNTNTEEDISRNFLKEMQEQKFKQKIGNIFDNAENLDEEYCALCNSYNVVQIDGYYTCRDCGNHNTNIINNEQEWRFYGQFDNKNSDPARCGMPVSDLIPNVSMGSVICSNWNSSYDVKRIKKNTILEFNYLSRYDINECFSEYD